jgi:hypothetical protein
MYPSIMRNSALGFFLGYFDLNSSELTTALMRVIFPTEAHLEVWFRLAGGFLYRT